MKVNIKPMAASESLHSSQPNLSMPKNRRGDLTRCIPIAGLSTGRILITLLA